MTILIKSSIRNSLRQFVDRVYCQTLGALMKHKKMRKYNRSQQQNRRRTAQNVRDALEGLKIPDYIDRSWCDQLHFNSVYPEEERTYGITNHAQFACHNEEFRKMQWLWFSSMVDVYMPKTSSYTSLVKKKLKRHLKTGQHANKWTAFRDIHVLVSPYR